jgi:hypothetical protein
MHTDFGEIEISGCNEMNIPVSCFLEQREDGKWEWTAANFMPRKGYANDGQYRVVADTKEEILSLIKKHVTPLFKVALQKLETEGELYYWEIDTSETNQP